MPLNPSAEEARGLAAEQFLELLCADPDWVRAEFDAIMAAAHLLSSDGAGSALDISAWNAAYDYYGHDATGVTYADQVLARAISWSQRGFCINCGIETAMVQAVHNAYGAPVAASLETAVAASSKPAKHSRN